MAALTCGMHGVYVRWDLYVALLLTMTLQTGIACGMVCMLLAAAAVAGMAMPAAGRRLPSGPSPFAVTDDDSSPNAGPSHKQSVVHASVDGGVWHGARYQCLPAFASACAVRAKVVHSAQKSAGSSFSLQNELGA